MSLIKHKNLSQEDREQVSEIDAMHGSRLKEKKEELSIPETFVEDD